MKVLPSGLAFALACLPVCQPAFPQEKPQQAQDAKEPREITIRYRAYKPPSPTFAVESNLVELRVTVRDSKGRAFAGLSASDFEIYDNKNLRPVEFFSEEKAVPPSPQNVPARQNSGSAPAAPASSPAAHSRSIVLFLDDTHGGIRALDQSKRAAEKFISSGMQPADRVAIFTDSGTVTIDFTSDSAALLAGLGRVGLHTQRGAAPLSECPTLTSYQAYVIANHLDQRAKDVAVSEAIACKCLPDDKACILNQDPYVQELASAVWDQTRSASQTALDVLMIAVQRLSLAPQDRILVILSPGFAAGDMQKQTSAILDAALRARIVINSIDSEGLVTAAEYPEGRSVDPAVRQMVLPELMSGAAAATGGQFVMNTNDVLGGMQSIVSVPEVSYLLGFTPLSRPDDKYHALKVKLSAAGNYSVQSRAGYFYAVQKNERGGTQQRLDREAFSDDQLSQIPVIVRISPGPPSSGQPTIVVNVGVDAAQLKFARRDGRQIQQLTFVTLLEDCAGHFIAGREAVMDLFLKASTLSSLQANGIHATLTFPAPKTPYRVRQVVRELVQNRLAASITSTECR